LLKLSEVGVILGRWATADNLLAAARRAAVEYPETAGELVAAFLRSIIDVM
jgi:hypothetical protein